MSKSMRIEPTDFLLFRDEDNQPESDNSTSQMHAPSSADKKARSHAYRGAIGRWTLALIGLGCIVGGIGFFFGDIFQTTLPDLSPAPAFEISFAEDPTPPSTVLASAVVPSESALENPVADVFSTPVDEREEIATTDAPMASAEPNAAVEDPVTTSEAKTEVAPAVTEPKKPEVATTLSENKKKSAVPIVGEALLKKDAAHFTIVLFRADNKIAVQHFVKKHAGRTKMSYHRGDVRGKPLYIVVSGDYHTRSSAMQALSKLPATWLSFKPSIEKYGVIQKNLSRRSS